MKNSSITSGKDGHSSGIWIRTERLLIIPMERNQWKTLRFLGSLARTEHTALFVRHFALSFLGETREGNKMVVGDIKVKAGLDHKVCEIFIWIG